MDILKKEVTQRASATCLFPNSFRVSGEVGPENALPPPRRRKIRGTRKLPLGVSQPAWMSTHASRHVRFARCGGTPSPDCSRPLGHSLPTNSVPCTRISLTSSACTCLAAWKRKSNLVLLTFGDVHSGDLAQGHPPRVPVDAVDVVTQKTQVSTEGEIQRTLRQVSAEARLRVRLSTSSKSHLSTKGRARNAPRRETLLTGEEPKWWRPRISPVSLCPPAPECFACNFKDYPRVPTNGQSGSNPSHPAPVRSDLRTRKVAESARHEENGEVTSRVTSTAPKNTNSTTRH